MLSYHSCSKAELATFVQARKLQVRSTAKTSTNPTKKDYVDALKKANANRTFPFLNLPPELRNRVYRELLVLRNTFTCHPQILGTAKNINKEASGILYGDNLIDINVYYAGVYTHGKRCGSYRPEIDLTQLPKSLYDQTTDLKWPYFIRRAQFVRFETLALRQQRTAGHMHSLIGTLHHIVYSLCCFLQGNHRLRSLRLNLGWLVQHFNAWRGQQDLVHAIEIASYPLRLLGALREFSFEGLAGDLVPSLLPLPTTLAAADKLLSGSVWAIMKQIKVCFSVLTRTTFLRDYNTFWSEALSWLVSLLSLIREGHDERGLLQDFFGAVNYVRDLWDIAPAHAVNNEAKARIEELVRLDVEVRMALGKNGLVVNAIDDYSQE